MHVVFLFVLWLALSIMQIIFWKTNPVETLLLNGLIINVGLYSLYNFMGHLFFADRVARSIGWPTGNPFQSELGMANLAIGVLGILCNWFHDGFWIATVVVFSVFLMGAAYVHIREMKKSKNFSPGNAGPVFYADIVTPLILVILQVIYSIRLLTF